VTTLGLSLTGRRSGPDGALGQARGSRWPELVRDLPGRRPAAVRVRRPRP